MPSSQSTEKFPPAVDGSKCRDPHVVNMKRGKKKLFSVCLLSQLLYWTAGLSVNVCMCIELPLMTPVNKTTDFLTMHVGFSLKNLPLILSSLLPQMGGGLK